MKALGIVILVVLALLLPPAVKLYFGYMKNMFAEAFQASYSWLNPLLNVTAIADGGPSYTITNFEPVLLVLDVIFSALMAVVVVFTVFWIVKNAIFD